MSCNVSFLGDGLLDFITVGVPLGSSHLHFRTDVAGTLRLKYWRHALDSPLSVSGSAWTSQQSNADGRHGPELPGPLTRVLSVLILPLQDPHILIENGENGSHRLRFHHSEPCTCPWQCS